MLYQVVESNKNAFNAGSKATADIISIAEKMSFKPLYVHHIEATHLTCLAVPGIWCHPR